MFTALSWTALFLGALALMEVVAYLTHRYLMHGPLWFVHRSHHAPRTSRFEWNDLFGLMFAIPSIAFIALGAYGQWTMLPIGLGMTAYGIIYFLVHDVVVHRRVRLRRIPHSRYLRRIVKAHLIHHRTQARDGAESFGFLYAARRFNRDSAERRAASAARWPAHRSPLE
jgi:beta-carotene 3-hydroxylase